MKFHTDDTRITGMEEVIAPDQLLRDLPLPDKTSRLIFDARQDAGEIIHGRDDRLLVIIGPCSVHDPDAALEYAQRLVTEAARHRNELLIMMRVYFEKPRTRVGWKGLINDPGLDDSFDINRGLHVARKLLLDVGAMGLPTGTEYLDPITPQYIGDLVAWGAIGARTTESQIHRQLASGLSCPIGFKNSTQGTTQVAVDAVVSASHPHIFLSVTKSGHSAIFSTAGNEDCHVILRGGGGQTNFDQAAITRTRSELQAAKLDQGIMIDFSHANSSKQHERQLEVCQDVCAQISEGQQAIMGVMVESNLVAGNQPLGPVDQLVRGQSITDACLGWDDSVTILEQLAEAVRNRRSAVSG